MRNLVGGMSGLPFVILWGSGVNSDVADAVIAFQYTYIINLVMNLGSNTLSLAEADTCQTPLLSFKVPTPSSPAFLIAHENHLTTIVQFQFLDIIF